MTHTPPHTLAKRASGFARTGLTLAVVAIALVAWNLFASHRAAAKLAASAEAQAIVTVLTTTPVAQAITTAITLPGSVQANYEAAIYARTSGYLRHWYVDIGAHVKAGALLAEIDAPELDQQLRQAQADVATAQANQSIAKVTAERWRGLRETDSVSKQEADEKISLAQAGDAGLLAAQANLQRLRELTAFKRIVAPFDGIVTARNTDVGQLITADSSAGPELFRIADIAKLRLYVRVPQTYAAAMQPGLAATVHFPDRPGNSYTAKLTTTSGAIDPVSRTLLAQLIMDNSQRELLPGAYAEVNFTVPASDANRALRLPANVLLFRGDGLQVATVDEHSRVVLKPVVIGRDFGSQVEIIHGLEISDRVILSPPDSLADHATVRVAAPAKPS